MANQVSTVDDADFISGQSVVIQALAVLLAGGKPGSYGMTGNGASTVAPLPGAHTARARVAERVTLPDAPGKKGKK